MPTKTYPLEVDKTLWEEYRNTVPRNINLDEPLISFIKNRVDEYNNNE